jgi:hypothetical protein
MLRRTIFALIATFALVVGVAGPALADKDDEKTGARDAAERQGKSDDSDSDDGDRSHGKRAGFGERGGKWVLHNDHIAVWFHSGKDKAKPDLRIAFNTSEEDEKSGYRVKILRLYEAGANDTEYRGSMPHINLARADDWNIVTEQTNESLTLTMVLSDAQGIVTLVWHIDTASAHVKYDVKVDNWRWANEGDRLVLDMMVVGKNLKNATGANVSVDDSGYISWETTAAATYADGTTGNLTVTPVKKTSKDEKDAEDADRGAHLLLVFDGKGGYKSLDYDPTFSVQDARTEAISSTPGVGTVALVATGFVVALFVARRRLDAP